MRYHRLRTFRPITGRGYAEENTMVENLSCHNKTFQYGLVYTDLFGHRFYCLFAENYMAKLIDLDTGVIYLVHETAQYSDGSITWSFGAATGWRDPGTWGEMA